LKHIKRLNGPERQQAAEGDVEAQAMSAFGCTNIFEPGWEADSNMSYFGLCRPMQRDVFGCSSDCWWPAQVPDEMSNYPAWFEECDAVEKDWKDIKFVK